MNVFTLICKDMKKIVRYGWPWLLVAACAFVWGEGAGFGVFMMSCFAVLCNSISLERDENKY